MIPTGVTVAGIVAFIAILMNAAIHSRNRELHALTLRQNIKLGFIWAAIFAAVVAGSAFLLR